MDTYTHVYAKMRPNRDPSMHCHAQRKKDVGISYSSNVSNSAANESHVKIEMVDSCQCKVDNGLSKLIPPNKVQPGPGPRALEVEVECGISLPDVFHGSSALNAVVQFKFDPLRPAQQPYGDKTATSVKKNCGPAPVWNERFVISIEDEKSPGPLSFEVKHWSRIQNAFTFGTATIGCEEMAALIAQDIDFETSATLPLIGNDGLQVMGPDDRASALVLRLRVVKDVTKTLLKFHPEVEINMQLDVEHLLETLSVKKSQLPYWRWAFLGLLSGVWMAISGCFAFSVAGGIGKADVQRFPILPRLVLGLLSPVAMHFIVIFGGEFFSGNCMFMTVGLIKERISLRSFLYVLLGSLMWNTIGCILFVFLFGWVTDIFNAEPQLSFIRQVAASKANMDFGTTFARAIPANIMICVSIHMGISARDMLGKLVALHFPLTVYTVAGFEHSIGNLVIVPLGAMYGGDVDIVRFMWANLLPAILGNFIGGAFVGLADVILFSWDHGLSNTNQRNNHALDSQELRERQAATAMKDNLHKLQMQREKSELLFQALEKRNPVSSAETCTILRQTDCGR